MAELLQLPWITLYKHSTTSPQTMQTLDVSSQPKIQKKGEENDFLDPEDPISPFQKRRNFLIKRTTYEFIHFLVVVAVSFSIYTRISLGTEYCHGARSLENKTLTSSFSAACINEHFHEVLAYILHLQRLSTHENANEISEYQCIENRCLCMKQIVDACEKHFRVTYHSLGMI